MVEVKSKTVEVPEEKGAKPDYRGKLDVAGWTKQDKNGNNYISLKIGSYVNLFPVNDVE